MRRLKYLISLLALTTVVVLLANYRWHKPPAIAQPLPEQLEGTRNMFALGNPSSLTFAVEFEGELVADQVLTLRAPVDGVLRRLADTAQTEVANDQELAFIESSELAQKVLENESQVEEFSATVQLYSPSSSPELRKLQAALDNGKQKYRYAETSFDKVEELFQRGLISGREHADALVQLRADKLELTAAEREFSDAQSLSAATYLKIRNQLNVALMVQAQLRQTQAKLTLRAPFAGRVRRYSAPKNHAADLWVVGDTVKAGDPLFYLESDQRIIRIDVGAQMLEHFSVGDTVTVSQRDDSAHAYSGRVEEIVRAPYEEGGLSQDEPVAQIRIGSLDAGLQHTEQRKVVVSKQLPQFGFALPAEVVFSEGAERFVFVKDCADRNAPFIRRRVTPGGEQSGTVLITAGLLSAECVASSLEAKP